MCAVAYNLKIAALVRSLKSSNIANPLCRLDLMKKEILCLCIICLVNITLYIMCWYERERTTLHNGHTGQNYELLFYQ